MSKQNLAEPEDFMDQHGLGDNQPPTDVDPLFDRLHEDHKDLIERRNALLDGIDRAPAVIEEGDEETAGKMADFVDEQLNKFIKHAKAVHENEKAPFLQAGRTVDGFKHFLIDDVEDGKTKVNEVRKTFADKKAAKKRRQLEEEARQAREEQARLEREAAEKAAALREENDLEAALAAEEAAKQAKIDAEKAEIAAAAKPAELGKSRGDYGGQTSLKQFWNVADINRETLDLEALRQHFTDDALKRAATSWKDSNKDFLKSGGTLTGARIFEDTRL